MATTLPLIAIHQSLDVVVNTVSTPDKPVLIKNNCALVENESSVRKLGDDALRNLAIELTGQLRKSATVDWQKRESIRQMRQKRQSSLCFASIGAG